MDITDFFEFSTTGMPRALADFLCCFNHKMNFRLYDASGDFLYEDNIDEYLNRDLDDESLEYIPEFEKYDECDVIKVYLETVDYDTLYLYINT